MNTIQLTHQIVWAAWVFNVALGSCHVLVNTGAYRTMDAVRDVPGIRQFCCARLVNWVVLAVAAVRLARALPAMRDAQEGQNAERGGPQAGKTAPPAVPAGPAGDAGGPRGPAGEALAAPPGSGPRRGGTGTPKRRKPRLPRGAGFMPGVGVGTLQKHYKREKGGAARAALLMAIHRKEGHSCKKISKMTATPKSTVYDTLRRMHETGLAGRYHRPRSGRPRKMDENLERRVADALMQEGEGPGRNGGAGPERTPPGPRVHGIASGVWTARTILALLESKFGVAGVSQGAVYRMLHRADMSWRTIGRPAHPKSPSRRQKTWYKKGLARRVAEWAAAGYTVLYMDEAHLKMETDRRRTWCRRGARLDQPVRMNGGRITCYGALGVGVAYRKYYDAGNTDNTLDFLKYVRERAGRVVLITDNASYHKGAKVREFLEGNDDVIMEFLPKYSPDLNCIEGLWREMKRHKANLWFDDTDEMKRHLEDAISGGVIPLPPLPDYVRIPMEAAGTAAA